MTAMAIDLSRVRSILCVPADNEDRVRKARDRGADLILLDLEDGVAPDRRPYARKIVAQYLGPDVAVRVNPIGTPDWSLDLDVALMAGLIFIPKVEAVTWQFAPHPAVLCIESPAAVLSVLPMLRPSSRRPGTTGSGVVGLAFGRADFAAAVPPGATHLIDHAALSITMAAASLGIHASDAPCYVLGNQGALAEEVARARRQGFHSKGCFHPQQIEAVNAGMCPAPAETAAARAILAARVPGVKRTPVGVVAPPLLALAERIVDR